MVRLNICVKPASIPLLAKSLQSLQTVDYFSSSDEDVGVSVLSWTSWNPGAFWEKQASGTELTQRPRQTRAVVYLPLHCPDFPFPVFAVLCDFAHFNFVFHRPVLYQVSSHLSNKHQTWLWRHQDLLIG